MYDKLILQYGLFPFDRIEKGATIAIYGDADIIQDYSDQVVGTGYCKITSAIDSKTVKKTGEKPLSAHTDGTVVVAAQSDESCGQRVFELREMGFSAEKIVMPGKFFLKEPKLIRLENFNWKEYYAQAEGFAQEQFYAHINPYIKSEDIKLANVLDFGCGHGRMSKILAGVSERLVLADIDADAVKYCKERFSPFGGSCRFEFIQNTKDEKSRRNIPLEDEDIDFLLSWDTVVHFSYKWIDRYFEEFFRILKHGGYALVHHANLGALTDYDASDIWILNQGGRSRTSSEDVKFIAQKHGFNIISQRLISGGLEEMDGITLLKKE